jgi:hypothetical protein
MRLAGDHDGVAGGVWAGGVMNGWTEALWKRIVDDVSV